MNSIFEKTDILVGDIQHLDKIQPVIPFKDEVIEFLSELSKKILFDKDAKEYADVISFGFWCRKSNINKLSVEHLNTYNRIGLGLVFHITPTNVPVNFAFSYAFSLLAGNSNIVRVPSSNFKQVEIICRIINNVFSKQKFPNILKKTLFIRYSQNDKVTSFLSNSCNARILWGGDKTVNTIRQIPIPARSIDISFSDRLSFSIIDPYEVSKLSDADLRRLALNFYNDTYLMDQNACSSPHLIVWKNEKKSNFEKEKNRFWTAVRELAESKYELQPVNAIDKFTLLCSDAINNSHYKFFSYNSNYLFQVNIELVPDNIRTLNGKFGYFYEVSICNINELSKIIETKVQTITYFGVDKKEILNFIIEDGLIGVDRIVPIGKALDIGIYWDGYDLIRTLSRVILVN